jgi:hypothetical protein
MLRKSLLAFSLASNFATLLGLWITLDSAPASVLTSIGHWLLLLGAAASIIGYIAFAVFVLRSRAILEKPKPLPDAESAPPALAEKTWSDVMAEDDAKKIQERVKKASQRIEFHYELGFDPYIEIITDLWNGSVFELVSFGEISGHSLYAGKQLAGDPRIIVSAEPALLRLEHGHTATLVVRQYVTADVADTMWANLNRGVVIDFESVHVSFKMLLPGFPKQDYRWWGPRFSIEDAKRV